MYFATEDDWYGGVVNKLTPKMVEIYFEESDTYCKLRKDSSNIERVANIGEGGESDSDDDAPLAISCNPRLKNIAKYSRVGLTKKTVVHSEIN